MFSKNLVTILVLWLSRLKFSVQLRLLKYKLRRTLKVIRVSTVIVVAIISSNMLVIVS